MGKVVLENGSKAGKVIVKKLPEIVKRVKKIVKGIDKDDIKKIFDILKYFGGNGGSNNDHQLIKPEEYTLQELEKRINILEQYDVEQAKLLSNISQAINSLSESSNILATRIIYIFCIASISFIITIYLLIKSFL